MANMCFLWKIVDVFFAMCVYVSGVGWSVKCSGFAIYSDISEPVGEVGIALAERIT